MRTIALALTLMVLAAPAAWADGDPASDVLLSQDSFLPYAPPVQPKLATALKAVLKQARDAGFPMKVALILTANDLGAYPQMFNTPQPYADLLTRELSALNPHGDPLKAVHLLVVMPGGFGGNNLGDGVDAALAPVKIQADAQSDGLARAAIEAVARLATANGHQVAVPAEAGVQLQASHKSTKRKTTSPLVFLAPALVLFAGLGLAGRIAKKRADRPV
ncbi:MAG: hypothetical protein QOF76_4112 [Solirubrobacteraceae bacterium]|jgi:GNAT superfamily N-acetyltransferase|nr:hypothetical protein [Solirubrobacteraceae bacterium]